MNKAFITSLKEPQRRLYKLLLDFIEVYLWFAKSYAVGASFQSFLLFILTYFISIEI